MTGRIKALLLAAACTVISPLAADATLTVNLSFGSNNAHGGATSFYLTPDNAAQDIPVYVYATVTGTAAISPVPTPGTSTNAPVTSGGNFDGLQYLYYNIFNSGTNEVTGGIDATFGPTLNSALYFNGTGPGLGQGGAVAGTVVNSTPSGTTPGTSVGTQFNFATATSQSQVTAALATIPKPRASIPIFDNFASQVTNSNAITTYTEYGNDGSNIILTGPNSVSLLVETLYYRPSTGAFVASTPASVVQTSLFPSVPTALLAALNLNPSNYFQDASTQNTDAPQPTSTAAYTAGANVTLLDARRGDTNADGVINFADLAIVIADYGQTTNSWAAGNFNSATDGRVDISDLYNTLANLTGPVPSTYPFPAALMADPNAVAALEQAGISPAPVPEPASVGLIALMAVAVARRGRVRRENGGF